MNFQMLFRDFFYFRDLPKVHLDFEKLLVGPFVTGWSLLIDVVTSVSHNLCAA